MKTSKIIIVTCMTLTNALNCMDQEPPRKSPKIAVSFLLNQAQPATKEFIFVDESFKHRCPYCEFWESPHKSLKKHLKEKHGITLDEYFTLKK